VSNCTALINPNVTLAEANELSAYEQLKPIIGIGFAFLSAIFTSLIFFTLKKLSFKKVHWATCTIFVCWVGLPIAVVLSIFMSFYGGFHQDISKELDDLPMDIFYSVLSSCFSLSGQIFLTKAMLHEEATKIAITKTIDVFFACVLQYVFLGIVADYLAIVGSCSILLATITIMGFKMVSKKYEDMKQQKQLEYEDEAARNSLESKEGPKRPKENVCLKFVFIKV
jgi:drug/metabolite transporter (DMT)-like permease